MTPFPSDRSYAGAGQEPKRDVPQVVAQIERTGIASLELERIVESLHARLGSVTNAGRPMEMEQALKAGPLVPLAETVRDIADRLNMVQRRLNGLLQSLEI